MKRMYSKIESILYKIILVVIFSSVLSSCKSLRIDRELTKSINTDFFEKHMVGFMLYDPIRKDTLIKKNADLYFTPASNTKIFTLYTALNKIGDSLPAVKYKISFDTIRLMGTGNPLFLHHYFKDSTTLKFASKYNKIELVLNNFYDDKFGPGWAWEDYDTPYSPERSGFPMYGNVLHIDNTSRFEVMPSLFKEFISDTLNKKRRANSKNQFYFNNTIKRTLDIPFIIDSTLIRALWEDLVSSNIEVVNFDGKELHDYKFLYSQIEPDSLYKRMMHESDNFLAEQMLVMSSSILSDSLSTEKVRQFILDKPLNNLKYKPRWVDGSGLSRYNLFTPSSLVYVLNELYNSEPRSRLLDLFPAGGESGTIEDWYGSDTEPYLYAKSGTLGNNYCLSGYLITKSGRTLIFSFMNNHFLSRTDDVRSNIQMVFEFIRDNY